MQHTSSAESTPAQTDILHQCFVPSLQVSCCEVHAQCGQSSSPWLPPEWSGISHTEHCLQASYHYTLCRGNTAITRVKYSHVRVMWWSCDSHVMVLWLLLRKTQPIDSNKLSMTKILYLSCSLSYSIVLSVLRTNTASNHLSGKKSQLWYSTMLPPADISSSSSSITYIACYTGLYSGSML